MKKLICRYCDEPIDEDDKRCGLSCAAFGIVGLETMLPVSLDLERAGVLSMPDLIAKMTSNPAELLNLPEGKLSQGNAADICIFDPAKAWVLDRNNLLSKLSSSVPIYLNSDFFFNIGFSGKLNVLAISTISP